MTRKQQPRATRSRRATKLMRGGMAAGLMAFNACAQDHTQSPGKQPDSAGVNGSAGMISMGISVDGGSAGTGASTAADGGLPVPIPDSAVVMPGQPAPSLFANDVMSDVEAWWPHVLYTWTTEEQYDALRSDRVLLTRTERPGVGHANLRDVLAAKATAGDALAKLLTGDAFQKGRFAWTNPWSTLRGWPGESYGDKLIGITLKPEAWIAKLVNGAIEVVDQGGAPVLLSDVQATPERIGAVYFVNDQITDFYCGTFSTCAPGGYREYFINNESMVRSWSVATPALLQEIERSITLIDTYRQRLQQSQDRPVDLCDLSGRALCLWKYDSSSYGSGETVGYLSSLSITSEHYLPLEANLQALIDALRAARFMPDPLTYEP